LELSQHQQAFIHACSATATSQPVSRGPSFSQYGSLSVRQSVSQSVGEAVIQSAKNLP